MTVGWPRCAPRRAKAAWILHQVVAAALQAVDLLVGQVGDQRRAAPGSGRRSGRGCRRRRWRRSVWNWPSTVCGEARAPAHAACRARTARPSREPHRHLMTCQPAPANSDSSSSTMRPLPRTGPSRRCRLQLTTKVRLSSCSRAASESARDRLRARPSRRRRRSPRRGGRWSSQQAAMLQVAHEARLVDRVDRPEAHRAGRELPEVGHQPRVRVADRPRAPLLGAPTSCR